MSDDERIAIKNALQALHEKPPRITIAVSYLKLALNPERNWAAK